MDYGQYIVGDGGLAAKSTSILCIITSILAVFIFQQIDTSSIPLLNPRKAFETSDKRAKTEFVQNGGNLLRTWFKANPDKPARLIGDVGNVIVLPPHLAQEIRNDKRLDFAKWTFKSFHAHLPGFDGFREGTSGKNLAQMIITKDLTKLLKWHTVPMKEVVLRIVAQVSSRAFLGTELCRHEGWLRITREYTVNGFEAAEELRMWPSLLRPLVHWFLPKCRNLRKQVKEARQVINATLHKRRELKEQHRAQGKEMPRFDDAIEWLEQAAKGVSYDPAAAQLGLSLAAIHTTTDLLCQALTRIALNQDILVPLREEIISNLRETGWQKNSLYNMKLLDSVLKESQRMKPTEMVSMTRLALEDIKLSDGTVIPANSGLAVSSHRMWDEQVHTHPEKWDPYRFYKMREEPGKQNISQLVSTGPNHLAFGHGLHACPGRFFAANELKILLIIIILQYDWVLPEGSSHRVFEHGFTLVGDPFIEMRIRYRPQGMDLIRGK
ncbi:hypothetical protein PFICI_07302 [Pestalotiopsis fici W106-1]|uniref:Uncharacterized protein n=1 Tax=Pestalotiopsis fici (strain W106-1 / CGMCC3.15140) TaxID=1229662 RepID=W3X8E0_PESFW|nr:uncharacterized protein PFICI_07302 [Pestalotiopsis fici W106-1]ETS82300.1 hypothetical protein PFICI_07302 [Pestalotiopsis fici W106-1]